MNNSTKFLSAFLFLSFLPVWGEAYQERKQLYKQSISKGKYTKLLGQEINKASLTGKLGNLELSYMTEQDVESAHLAVTNAIENNFAISTPITLGFYAWTAYDVYCVLREAYKIEQTQGLEASMKYLAKEGATEVVTRLLTKGAGKILAKVAGATGFAVFLKKLGQNLGKKAGQKMENNALKKVEKECLNQTKKKAKNKIKRRVVQNSECKILKETDKKLVQLSSHSNPPKNSVPKLKKNKFRGKNHKVSYKSLDKKELAKRLNVDKDKLHPIKEKIIDEHKSLLRKKNITNSDICASSNNNIVLKHLTKNMILISKSL